MPNDELDFPVAADHPAGKRAFNERLKTILSDHPNVKSLNILHLDIDWFLAYNDHFGHESGDKTLRNLYAILCKTSGNETVYRVSGQEFAVVLTEIEKDQAVAFAERLRLAVLNANLPNHYPHMNVTQLTVSIGVAHFTMTKTPPIEALFIHAATATTEAKRAGRNQTHAVDIKL